MNLYQKLIEVRKTVPYLQKENQGAQYNYVSSSQVLATCKAKMDELGVLLVPAVIGHKVNESAIEYHDKDGNINKRTITYFTELDMTMTWINVEKPDETIVCSWYGQGVDIAGEKGVGKALTYAEKYFMLKFFNIPTDKDDPDSFQKKEDDLKPNGKQTTVSNGNVTPINKKAEPDRKEYEGIPLCQDCGKPLDETDQKAADVIAWCTTHAKQFQNKIICKPCQRNYQARKAQ